MAYAEIKDPHTDLGAERPDRGDLSGPKLCKRGRGPTGVATIGLDFAPRAAIFRCPRLFKIFLPFFRRGAVGAATLIHIAIASACAPA